MTINIKSAPDHNALYQIAEQQAGYFTTAQASLAGFTRPLIAHHVRKGQFLRIKHGIYRLARFPEAPQADLFVALLEVGPKAVISHGSALALYNLSDSLPGAIHLTVPRTSSRRHPGLRLHTSRLSRDEVTQRGGLPVTTVTRTLADLISGHWPEEQIFQAIQEAVQRGLVTRKGLSDYAEMRGGQVDQLMRSALRAERER
jgi:predicted transcriptional regulator of viral defense system